MIDKKIAFSMVFGLSIGITTFSSAEILVILPETGPMASASESIKRGFVQANQLSTYKYQIKFVNVNTQPLADILKKYVSKSTELVVGPLDKQNVEQLIALQPKVKTLALNQVDSRANGVYQFALSKDEDALALTKRMQWDGVERISVFRDPKSIAQTQSFFDAMQELWGDKLQVKDGIPLFLRGNQAVLLLGGNEWMMQQKLPKKQIYTLPYAIAENVKLPEGLVYCDTPALYTGQWEDVISAYRQQPVTLPFQRLIAFGGDAWQIADQLKKQKSEQPIEFLGRTGKIRIVGGIIERQPQCFRSEASGQQTAL